MQLDALSHIHEIPRTQSYANLFQARLLFRHVLNIFQRNFTGIAPALATATGPSVFSVDVTMVSYTLRWSSVNDNYSRILPLPT